MITAPGIYNIDIEAYHRDPRLCDGPSISASGLKAVAECPAKYWAFSPLNPHRLVKESTAAFDFGRAAHALVLGEPEFAKHFIISPYAEFRTNEAKAWRDAQTKTIIKPDAFDVIRDVAAAQRASQQCARACKRGRAEMSLIHKDEETGIWVKSRPDWHPDEPAGAFIIDYKSAVSIEPEKWAYDMHEYGYPMQAAMQVDAVRAVLGVEPLGVAHIVQEKTPPYLCELRMVSPEQIDNGRFLFRRALRIFANCLNAGKWTGYTTEPQFTPTPHKYTKMMEGLRNGTGDDAAIERQRALFFASKHIATGG